MNLYALRDFFNMVLDMNANVVLGSVLAIWLFLCWLFVKIIDSSPSFPAHILAKATGILTIGMMILTGGKTWKENLLFCGPETTNAEAGFDVIQQL